MTIVYDDLVWQTQNIANAEIEKAEVAERMEKKKDPLTDSKHIDIFKETHHIRDGLRLVREHTYTTKPLHYQSFEVNDYIGVCFVFAPKDTDIKKLAFKNIYHDNLNITNGFAYQAQTLSATNTPLDYVSLQFDSAYIESLNETQAVPNWLLRLASKKNGEVLDQVEVPVTLRHLAWQISQMPSTYKLSDALRMEAKAVDWLAGLIENGSSPTTPSMNAYNNDTNNHKKFVVHACDIIHSEYSQPLTINELALRVGTNTSYLKRYFKYYMKQSIHDYLTEYRLQQAKYLLIQQPKLEVGVIAQLCGYQAGRFSQVFKENFGETPSEYRLK